MPDRQAFRTASFLRHACGIRSFTQRRANLPSRAGTARTATSLHLPAAQHLAPRAIGVVHASNIHTSAVYRIDILESADKPQDVKQPDQGLQSTQAAPLSDEEYHERADKFLEELLEKLEEKSEESGELDIEYAAGVMNITLPSKGTYVLNKQPPNKQIWLSSPESGPKRYDWVIHGESMEHKAGGEAVGDWVYLRDGSSLADLLRVEVGVKLESAGRDL